MWRLHFACFALIAACTPSTKVEFVDGKCLIDGLPTSLAHVEARQAAMTQHVLSRQPLLTGIAIAAVVLACAGYIPRILTVLAARRASEQSFAERVRARMEAYRRHPVRYFLLIGSIISVLVAAGVAYVSMDADKRTSERALANLQFCHLALRSADEQHVLAEQRDHLASIQSTEHDIRALVDKLPPAEQQKGREIAAALSTSLGQQRTMVAQYAEHADTTAHQVEAHQEEVAHSLSKLDGEVVDLKSLPAAVAKLDDDIHDVGTHTVSVAGEVEACNARLETLQTALAALGKQLDSFVSRPASTCPACTCSPVATTPPAVATGSAAPREPAKASAAPPDAATRPSPASP
ncbi:MAG TPA: hypothetical protein VGF94_05230 [Kofleriaceae bacterium]|jgi:hypothetical protein